MNIKFTQNELALLKNPELKNEMDRKLINEISRTIQSFNDFLQAHLPALEIEINSLIESKSKVVNLLKIILAPCFL